MESKPIKPRNMVVRRILLILLVISIFMIPIVKAIVETIRIYPSDDTMGMEINPTTNLGDQTFISIRNQTGGDNITSWIKFDLTGLPVLSSINLSYLYLYSISSVVNGNVSIFQLDNQTWTEMQPTWNSPVKGTKSFLNWSIANAVSTRFAFNVTTWVQNQYNAGKDNVSMTILKIPRFAEGARHSFSSKEEVLAQRPYLNVTVTYTTTTTTVLPSGLAISGNERLTISGDSKLTIS